MANLDKENMKYRIWKNHKQNRLLTVGYAGKQLYQETDTDTL